MTRMKKGSRADEKRLNDGRIQSAVRAYFGRYGSTYPSPEVFSDAPRQLRMLQKAWLVALKHWLVSNTDLAVSTVEKRKKYIEAIVAYESRKRAAHTARKWSQE